MTKRDIVFRCSVGRRGGALCPALLDVLMVRQVLRPRSSLLRAEGGLYSYQEDPARRICKCKVCPIRGPPLHKTACTVRAGRKSIPNLSGWVGGQRSGYGSLLGDRQVRVILTARYPLTSSSWLFGWYMPETAMLSSVGFPERNRVGMRGTGNNSVGIRDVATVFRNSGV